MVTDVFRDLSWTSSVPVRLIVAGHVIDYAAGRQWGGRGYVPYEQLWDQVRARSRTSYSFSPETMLGDPSMPRPWQPA